MFTLINISFIILVFTSLEVPTSYGQRNTYLSVLISGGRVENHPILAKRRVDEAISRLLRELEALKFEMEELKSANDDLDKFTRRLRMITRQERVVLNVERIYLQGEWRKLAEERMKLDKYAQMIIAAINETNTQNKGKNRTEEDQQQIAVKEVSKKKIWNGTDSKDDPSGKRKPVVDEKMKDDLEKELEMEKKKVKDEKDKIKQHVDDAKYLVANFENVLTEKRKVLEDLMSKINDYKLRESELSDLEINRMEELKKLASKENGFIEYLEIKLTEQKNILKSLEQTVNKESNSEG